MNSRALERLGTSQTLEERARNFTRQLHLTHFYSFMPDSDKRQGRIYEIKLLEAKTSKYLALPQKCF